MFNDMLQRRLFAPPVEQETPKLPATLNPRVHGRGNKTTASKRKRAAQHRSHESRRRNFHP